MPAIRKQSVLAACSCLSLQPSTVTTTVTNTDTKKATTTVKACTTITQSATTTSTVTESGDTSYALPTSFYIQNDNSFFAVDPMNVKEVQDVAFSDNTTNEILFALNSAGNLIHENGKLLAEPSSRDADGERESIQVNTATQSDVDAGLALPLTCSVSYSAEDGTCPLKCQVEAGDVNQVPQASNWFLGPPGFAGDQTFNTFAVVRGASSGRGRGGRSVGRSNRSRR